MVDKSESSSFEDLASAAAHEIEEAKLAEAAAAEKTQGEPDKPAEEWQDVLGSGALLKKVHFFTLTLHHQMPPIVYIPIHSIC